MVLPTAGCRQGRCHHGHLRRRRRFDPSGRQSDSVVKRIHSYSNPAELRCARRGTEQPGNGIKDAKVTLEVPGRPPLDAYTDSNGVATIIVPAQYVGGSAVIIVEAPGFATFRQNIRVERGSVTAAGSAFALTATMTALKTSSGFVSVTPGSVFLCKG